jgi:hypothetical protein
MIFDLFLTDNNQKVAIGNELFTMKIKTVDFNVYFIRWIIFWGGINIFDYHSSRDIADEVNR